MKQGKYVKKTPDRGDKKVLVNVKYALCSIIMGSPTEEWGEPPSPGLILCQTSTQEVLQTEHIKNKMKKCNVRKMRVGDTMLDAAAEAGIN